MNASELNNKEVIGKTGTMIGRVKDAVIDENTWQVKSLQIELESDVAKEIGMKKTFGHTTLPLPLSYVGGVGDKVMVSAPREELIKYVSTLKA